MDKYHGYVPSMCTIDMYHLYAPWICTIDMYHGYVPWIYTIDMYHGYVHRASGTLNFAVTTVGYDRLWMSGA